MKGNKPRTQSAISELVQERRRRQQNYNHENPQKMLLDLLQSSDGGVSCEEEHDDEVDEEEDEEEVEEIDDNEEEPDDTVEAISLIRTAPVKTKSKQLTILKRGCIDEGPSTSAAASKTKSTKPSSDFDLWTTFKATEHIPRDILDDLATRFIINHPNLFNNMIRLCFEIELAHWFYMDFYCSKLNPKTKQQVKGCSIRSFALAIFEHVPALQRHLPRFDKIFEDWKNYKQTVPTFGAIILSDNLLNCVLVQSYLAHASWGFPKGKVNESETPISCAQREVYEETGYDISKLLNPKEYVDAVVCRQYIRLYIVKGVPMGIHFTPRTRKEIKRVAWFPIDALPQTQKDNTSEKWLGIKTSAFYLVRPFVKKLKEYVEKKRLNEGGVFYNSLHLSKGLLSPDALLSPMPTANSQHSKSLTATATATYKTSSFRNKGVRKQHKSLGTGSGNLSLPRIKSTPSSDSDSSDHTTVLYPLKRTQKVSNLTSISPPLPKPNAILGRQLRGVERKVQGRLPKNVTQKELAEETPQAESTTLSFDVSFDSVSKPHSWLRFSFDKSQILSGINEFCFCKFV